ncbi:MAG TPA: adenylate/guanylate cyclase domain-containing protein [Usitatibacter sp.]|nr:adenylate/guanylate cyclase domain-containing protein [Usitatibacter sp.]
MRDPLVNEALRQIQDIVVQETGTALPLGAKTRVEKVLHSALGQLAGSHERGGYLTREVTILLADLRGFTSISASHPAAVVFDLLNRCFVAMSEIIFRHQGAIDKFMGDSILVLFESPRGSTDGVCRALSCAVDMQSAMEGLNAVHKAQGMPEMYFGIGINTGQVMSALLGSDLYSEYAVIGDEVNLASRIESFSLRGQILISESTFERCNGFVTTGEAMDVFVKGKSKLVVLREVLSIPSLAKVVPRQDFRRSLRVEVKLTFSYQVVVNGVVVPEPRNGRILDISYHGILAEIGLPLSPFTEVKLEFDLPLVGKRVNDLYGKVVKVIPKPEATRVGVEFSSMSAANKANIQLFVQFLIQGSESRN